MPVAAVRSAWTQDQTDTLRQLYASGLSYSKIAARLGGGLTRNAVCGKVDRLGLQRATPSLTRAAPKPPTRSVATQAPAAAAAPIISAPQPISPPKPESAPSAGKPFRLLERHECRWPLNHPFQAVTADTLFCGAPRANAHDDGLHGHYCRRHQAMSKRGGA